MTDDQYDVFERRRRGEAHTVIAEELGISAEASRKRLHDGLEKLHEAVSKRGLI
jgi:DNA-directed RNA polymerase specialized sigma24 family protein